MKLLVSLIVQCFVSLVYSQTVTTTDAAGNTIVEFITVDPAAGITTTSIIETLAPGTTTTPPPAVTTTPTTFTTDPQQGPVGQPAPTIPGQVTSYRYTTTDANGDTIVVNDIFTPSFAPSQPPPPPTTTGSVLGYSEWLSLIGTNTVPVLINGAEPWRIPGGAYKVAAGMVTGLVGGAMLVMF